MASYKGKRKTGKGLRRYNYFVISLTAITCLLIFFTLFTLTVIWAH